MAFQPELSLRVHEAEISGISHVEHRDHRRWGRQLRYHAYFIGRRLPLQQFHLRQDVAEKSDHFAPIALDGLANPHHGEKILSGKFYCQHPFPVGLYEFVSRPDPETHMRRAGLSPSAIHQLQSFDWLADLHAYVENPAPRAAPMNLLDSENPLDKTRRFCVDFIQTWIAQHQHYSPISWHIPTLARRINNWLFFYDSLFNQWNSNDDLAMMRSITMQLHHLRLCVMNETSGVERIFALICWVNTSLCLITERYFLEEGKVLLGQELQQQLADTQSALLANPLLVNKLLFQLQNLNKAFIGAGLDVPFTQAAAELRLAVLLRHYQFRSRHRLACFHGCHAHVRDISQSEQQFSRQRLVSAHTKLKRHCDLLPLKRIDHHGFTLFLDAASRRPSSTQQHYSPLAIELADGQHMLFVNAQPPHPKEFQQYSNRVDWRGIRNHSGVHLEDSRSSSRGDLRGGSRSNLRGDLRGGRQTLPGYRTQCQIVRDQAQVWLEASHNGIQTSRRLGGATLGKARLSRTLYFSPEDASERVVRGMDELHVPENFRGRAELTLVSQFHLHPDIDVTPLKGGGILLHDLKKQYSWNFSSPDNAHINLIRELYSAERGQGHADDTPPDHTPLQTLRLSRTIALPDEWEAGQRFFLQWEIAAK